MNILILTRGAPGCGKSTFLSKNVPEGVSILSADDLRLKIQAPVQKPDGTFQISQENDGLVWSMLFQILEERMKLGQTIVVDSTNSKTSEMSRYKDYADKYRYRVYLVDFTNLPIGECKRRNSSRLPEYKRVPSYVIDNQYSRFETQRVPSGITVIPADDLEFKKLFEIPLVKLDRFKSIYVIGDIHGCHTVMNEFLSKHFNGDSCYIFVGDYIDRGTKSVEVINDLMHLKKQYPKNIVLLKGNHERHLFDFANDKKARSRFFESVTKKQFGSSDLFSKKDIRDLYRKMLTCSFVEFHGQKIFISHAGIAKIDPRLSVVDLIRGVGKYEDIELVEKTFHQNHPEIIQVHGHRNVKENAIYDAETRSFNLEGKVEFGGFLRAVKFYCSDGKVDFETLEYKNDHDIMTKHDKPSTAETNNSMTVVEKLRQNSGIVEKVFEGGISSFNFSRGVFSKAAWDDMRIKARGLFIDRETNAIVSRSYNKFFNYEERDETSRFNLEKNLKFPVKVYKKYNGYLGIVGVHNGRLFLSSKTDCIGEYAQRFKELFDKLIPDDNKEKLLGWLSENNSTAVFEVILPKFDPHIVEYDSDKLVLLDLVKNDLNTFSKASYGELRKLAIELGLEVKELTHIFNDIDSLFSFVSEVKDNYDYTLNGENVEGFVLEDANGFMFKLKSKWYSTWKHLRKILREVSSKGYSDHTSSLLTPLENRVYKFIVDKFSVAKNKEMRKALLGETSIIDIRKEFFARSNG